MTNVRALQGSSREQPLANNAPAMTSPKTAIFAMVFMAKFGSQPRKLFKKRDQFFSKVTICSPGTGDGNPGVGDLSHTG
jgi:hypothetical protein